MKEETKIIEDFLLFLESNMILMQKLSGMNIKGSQEVMDFMNNQKKLYIEKKEFERK